jgi:CBS domain-containing protein
LTAPGQKDRGFLLRFCALCSARDEQGTAPKVVATESEIHLAPGEIMPISECCNIGVVCCEATASLPEVAGLMRKHHVGDVVVVEQREGERIPLGIVTDRDIVIETLALQLDAKIFTAGDIMAEPLVTVREDEGLVETMRLMRNYKIRRLPVLTHAGTLYGIVTADDIINLLAEELSLMSAAIVSQPLKESRLRH